MIPAANADLLSSAAHSAGPSICATPLRIVDLWPAAAAISKIFGKSLSFGVLTKMNGCCAKNKSSISIDHENMANNYLNMLSKALMEHYSISGTNANYLAWGGLHESSKWGQLSQDQKNQILQTNHEYRSGVKGVKCK